MTHVELPAAVRDLLAPPEQLLVSQWVEKYRILHERDAAEPGPFSFDRIPYMVEPTDALLDPTVQTIVYVKASRCSGSELINNHLSYSIDQRPMPTIYVLPRRPDVKEEFEGRLKRMVQASPRLQRQIPGGNWATENALVLLTMTVMSAAATVEENFLRRTSGLNLFDEVDNCAEEAMASRLGDIWTLLKERLTTYGYRGKQVGVTTPTTTEGAGWKAWLSSDQRRYHSPCPACGHYQVLRFEQIKLIPEAADERDPERIEIANLARYGCESCGALHADDRKLWMTQRGVWVPDSQKILQRLDVASKELIERSHFRTPTTDRWRPKIEGPAPQTRQRGYWADAAVSPWRTFSAFLAKFFATRNDPPAYRVFFTHWRALPWKEQVQSVDSHELTTKVQLGGPPDVIPDRAVRLLCYADVQWHWLWYVFAAFGPGEECWIVRAGSVEKFDEIEKLAFESKFPYADDPAQSLTCEALGYDTGDGHRTAECYDRWLARPHQIVLTKGQQTLVKGEKWNLSQVEYHPSGRRNPHGVRLAHVNTSFFKEKLYGTYKRPGDGPGTIHFHRETSQAFLEQITAEHYQFQKPRRRGARGKWVWSLKVDGRDNHYLDCLVGLYCMADMRIFRNLPTRQQEQAQLSQLRQPATPGGLRTPDGRPFFATQRRR